MYTLLLCLPSWYPNPNLQKSKVYIPSFLWVFSTFLSLTEVRSGRVKMVGLSGRVGSGRVEIRNPSAPLITRRSKIMMIKISVILKQSDVLKNRRIEKENAMFFKKLDRLSKKIRLIYFFPKQNKSKVLMCHFCSIKNNNGVAQNRVAVALKLLIRPPVREVREIFRFLSS